MLKTKIVTHFLIALLISFSSVANAKLPDRIMHDLNITDDTENIVQISAPDIAETGAVVPLTIKRIPTGNVKSFVKDIYIYSDSRKDKVEHLVLGKAIIPEDISTRIKLGETSKVYVVAMLSDGRVLSGEKLIKVTVGGCGDASSGFLTPDK